MLFVLTSLYEKNIKKTKKKISTYSFLVGGFSILFILFFLSMGFTSYKNKQPQSQPPVEDAKENWKTYTNSQYGFGFRYPPDLVPLELVGGQVLFFKTKSEAQQFDNCIKNRLGSIEKPCAGMILNIGMSSSIASSMSSNPDEITQFTDPQNRIWKTQGPIPGIDGASNYEAQFDTGTTYYHVTIQIGEKEFAEYLGKTLIIESPKDTYDYSLQNQEQKKLGDQILSTFRFLK